MQLLILKELRVLKMGKNLAEDFRRKTSNMGKDNKFFLSEL